MRELTTVEIEEAGGGVLGILGAFAIGFGGSLAASYAYEKFGGAEGIENALSDVWDAFVDGVVAQQQLCQETGLGCGSSMM